MSIHSFRGAPERNQEPDEDNLLIRRGTLTQIIRDNASGTTDYVISSVTGCTRLRGIREEDGGTGGIPEIGAAVEAYGYPESLNDAEGVVVEFARIPIKDLSIELVPMVCCPPAAVQAMQVVIATVMSLSDDLRVFLSRVIGRPQIAKLFMGAPASLSAHDAYPGGLVLTPMQN